MEIIGRKIVVCATMTPNGVFDMISLVFLLPSSQSVTTNCTTTVVCTNMDLVNMTVYEVASNVMFMNSEFIRPSTALFNGQISISETILSTVDGQGKGFLNHSQTYSSCMFLHYFDDFTDRSDSDLITKT